MIMFTYGCGGNTVGVAQLVYVCSSRMVEHRRVGAAILVWLLVHGCKAQGSDTGVNIPWYIWLIISLAFGIAVTLVICTLVYIFHNCAKMCRMRHPQASDHEMDRLGLIPVNDRRFDHVDVGNIAKQNKNLCWELDRGKIKIVQQLGIGDYGPIYDAEVNIVELNIVSRALIKVFQKGTSQDLVRFRQDVDKVMDLYHPHVTKLLGVVSHTPYYAVYELTVNGDLKSFLVSSLEEPITPTQLVAMATDVALGLSYLESVDYVHTDIAARSCVVTQNLAVKIADYKVGRCLFRSEYAVQTDGSLLPLRWMSPEAILSNKYTFSSNVWSFGVLLWEVMSRGMFPYSELGDEEVAVSVCQNRGCPSTLHNCSQTIQQVMERCWDHDEKRRPKMKDVHGHLESNIMAKI